MIKDLSVLLNKRGLVNLNWEFDIESPGTYNFEIEGLHPKFHYESMG
jgi:hypothetical protein